jgi:hypothetical protein
MWSTTNYDWIGAAAGSTSLAACSVAPFYGSKRIYALEGARGNVSAFWGEWNQQLTADFWY